MQHAFSVLETFILGQNEQLPRQQMHPDRYKQCWLWVRRADPTGLSEGKKHQGSWAADLPLPLCTSTALSYWFMINTNKVVSDRSAAWPDTKGNMTQVCHPCDTNSLCCCKSLCSIFATETFSSWPGDKQVCPVFCWHTHCFMSDVILSNSEVSVLMLNQWSVTHTLHRCCTCLLQRSVLPWHFISYPTVVNLKSALNCSIIFPFISVCADRIPVGCSFPVYWLL